MEFTHPDYTILKRLGQGASGSVYLAVQNQLNRKVAVKVVNDSLADNQRQRFIREAHILAQLDHPHIVSVYELAELHDRPGYLLAMAYVDGGTLRERAQEFSLRDALMTVQQIAQALGFAHRHGFIHRDVKPDNILFQDNQAMLADFGIARLTDSQTQMTHHGALLGTPTYMSPEQVNSNAVDMRSDLYSLGVVFYELLAGAPPFRADSAIATGIQHLTQPIPALPSVFSCYQPLIDRVLAKNRDDRPANTSMFLEELHNATAQMKWPLDEELHWLRTQQDFSPATVKTSSRNNVVTAVSALSVVTIAGVAGWYFFLSNSMPVTEESSSLPTDAQKISSPPVPAVKRLSSDGVTAGIGDGDSVASGLKSESDTQRSDELAEKTLTAEALIKKISDAQAQQQSGNWFNETPHAVSLFQEVLAIDPQQATAVEALQEMTEQTRISVQQQINDKNWNQVAATFTTLRTNWPDFPHLTELTTLQQQSFKREQEARQRQAENRAQQQAQRQRVLSLINKATAAEADERLLQPAENNAVFYYRAALQEEPGNDTSASSIERIKQLSVLQITELIAEDINSAQRKISLFGSAFPNDPALDSLTSVLNSKRATMELDAQRENEARQQVLAIDALDTEVDEWLALPDEKAAEDYPPLSVRISAMLERVPDNQKLIRMQTLTDARLNEVNANVSGEDDDIFRMPGF